jgi:hypothetical protein
VQLQLDLVASLGAQVSDIRLQFPVREDARGDMLQKAVAMGMQPRRPWLIVHIGETAPSRRYPDHLLAAAIAQLQATGRWQSGIAGGTGDLDAACRIAARVEGTVSLAGLFDLAATAAGRIEFGPRALGSRSILASPLRGADAGATQRAQGSRELPSGRPGGARGSCRRMVRRLHALAIHAVRASRQRGAARAHPRRLSCRRHGARADGGPARQPALPRVLIAAFAQRSGVPAVINTSFNTRGKPIVCTPLDALECFFASRLDVLAIGPYVIEKNA